MMETYLNLDKVDLQCEEAHFRPIITTKQGAQVRKSGKMSYTRARELAHSALSGIRLDSTLYGAHSLRAGGATAAACAGIPDRAFKRHGWWRVETIAALM